MHYCSPWAEHYTVAASDDCADAADGDGGDAGHPFDLTRMDQISSSSDAVGVWKWRLTMIPPSPLTHYCCSPLHCRCSPSRTMLYCARETVALAAPMNGRMAFGDHNCCGCADDYSVAEVVAAAAVAVTVVAAVVVVVDDGVDYGDGECGCYSNYSWSDAADVAPVGPGDRCWIQKLEVLGSMLLVSPSCNIECR